jgi:hypothetical protein
MYRLGWATCTGRRVRHYRCTNAPACRGLTRHKEERPSPRVDCISRRHVARRRAPRIIPSGPKSARIHRAGGWDAHLHPNHRLARREDRVVVKREPDERRGTGACEVALLVPVPTPSQVRSTSCWQDADVVVVTLLVTSRTVPPTTEARGPVHGRVDVDIVMGYLGVPYQ